MNKEPKTLQEAMIYFSDKQNAVDFVIDLRWSEGITCPKCGSKELYYVKTRYLWQCKNKECKKQFTVKTGTIFEDSPLGLDKWLCAIWMIANAKNGISSYEIARGLGMTQKSAWFVLHRIRYAMQQGSLEKLSGDVEADETYVGGKAENMHKWKREAMGLQGRGTVGKAVVFGLLERTTGNKASKVKTKVVENARKKTLQPVIRRSVETESNLYTDALKSYQGMEEEYVHQSIDHATEYVRGNVHTNGIENYWSLFKRTLRGTYVNCNVDHLDSYLDEQTFRFNNRVGNDAERFSLVLGSVAGRRLTYKQLIIKKTFKQLNFFRKLN
jgi:transposase-like protein